jgi:phage-related minor tail protein
VRTVWRGIRRFLQIYLAYFLLTAGIVVAGIGIESGGAGTIAIALVLAAVLLLLAARVAGVRRGRGPDQSQRK